MADHHLLYKKAQYYDVIFNRDVSGEVDFLISVTEKFTGRKPQAAIELACGPGYHTLEVARRGLTSYGLDLNDAMIALGKERADREGLDAVWIQQDFRNFSLPEPVDFAYVMFDGFDALTDNADILAHLEAVAHNLKEKGIYFIDLSHPFEYSIREYASMEYSGERDGVRVHYIWGTNDPVFDLLASTAQVEVTVEVDDHGEVSIFKDIAVERMLIPQEIILLAQLSGVFEVVDWYGDFDPSIKFDPIGRTRRMIAVLQKKE